MSHLNHNTDNCNNNNNNNNATALPRPAIVMEKLYSEEKKRDDSPALSPKTPPNSLDESFKEEEKIVDGISSIRINKNNTSIVNNHNNHNNNNNNASTVTDESAAYASIGIGKEIVHVQVSNIPLYAALAYQTVRRLLSFNNFSNWDSKQVSNDITIFNKKEKKESAAIFKGLGIVPFPPASLLDLLCDTQRKRSYDEIFDRSSGIEDIDPHSRIEHQLYWTPSSLIVTPRDFCVYGLRALLSDGRSVVAARSVIHPNCPAEKKKIRATIFIGGYILTPLNEEKQPYKIINRNNNNNKGSISLSNDLNTSERPSPPSTLPRNANIGTSLPPLPPYNPPTIDSSSLYAPYTQIEFIAQTDLGGSLPGPLKRELLFRQPLMISSIAKLSLPHWKNASDEIKNQWRQMISTMKCYEVNQMKLNSDDEKW